MRILSNPALPQIAPLLEQCGLPTDDIRSEYLPDFVLAMEGETPVGVAGLQVFGESALVRSVAVAPGSRSQGLGSQLLSSVESRARERGVRQLYLLTNEASAYFAKHGYTEYSRCSAPKEIQSCDQFGSSCCSAASLMGKQIGG